MDMRYKLHKALTILKEHFLDSLSLLPEEFSQPYFHYTLSSTIRVYSEKHSQNFANKVTKNDQPEPNIKKDIKANLISFLPSEEQWDAIMLSKGGLEDPWIPEQKVIGINEESEEPILKS